MSDLIIEIGDAEFRAKFEKAKSPNTCAAFKAAMPLGVKLYMSGGAGGCLDPVRRLVNLVLALKMLLVILRLVKSSYIRVE